MRTNDMNFIKSIPMPLIYGKLEWDNQHSFKWDIEFINDLAFEICESALEDSEGKDIIKCFPNFSEVNDLKDILMGKSNMCITYFPKINSFLKITRQEHIDNYFILYINQLVKPFSVVGPDDRDKMIYVKNEDGIYVDCNEAFKELCDLKEDIIYGKTDIDLWSKDNAEIFGNTRIKFLNNHNLYSETFITIKGRIYLIHREAIYHNGKLIGFIGICDALQSSNHNSNIMKYSDKISNAIKDTVPDHIYFRDNFGVFIDCNESFLHDLGLKREDVIGKTCEEIKPLSHLSEMVMNTDEEVKLSKSKKIYFDENIINGKYSFSETIKTPFIDSYGNVSGVVGVTRDVSHRKELDRLRFEFFANLSHELRTPLNLIFSSLQATTELEKEVLNNNKRLNSYFNIIDKNSKRLLKLVNNLIDTTRVDCGDFEYSPVNGNIVNYIEDICMSVAEFVEEKNLSLIIDTNVEEKWMDFDHDKLERIMLNLLSNSIKYNKNPGEIEVILIAEDDNFNIVVKDTGYGIPKDKLESVFEVLKPIENRLRKRNEGSGVGLSLTKALVEIQGGTIEVESEVGLGSIFTVRLPIRNKYKNRISKTISIDDAKRELRARMNVEFSDIYRF